MTIVPVPFLFRYSLPVQRVDKLPRAKAPVLQLPDACKIAPLSQLSGEKPFAEIALAWSPQGFCVQVTVPKKKRRPICDRQAVPTSDAVLLWIDTRHTQTMHRASKFCHHFIGMPSGGGKKDAEPILWQTEVARARETSPEHPPSAFQTEADVSSSGYRLSMWLPAETLHGYDPTTHGQLGFYIVVQDTEHGQQPLTVGSEFPYEADPSQWVSLELAE